MLVVAHRFTRAHIDQLLARLIDDGMSGSRVPFNRRCIAELPFQERKVMEIWFSTDCSDTETARKGKWRLSFVPGIIREVKALIKIRMGALTLESKIGTLEAHGIAEAMSAGPLFES